MFEKGSKVKVTAEGTMLSNKVVQFMSPGQVYVIATLDIDDACVESVELIEPPRPEWYPLRNGDVFEWESDGRIFVRYVLNGKVFGKDGNERSALYRYNGEWCNRVKRVYRFPTSN